MIYIRTTAERLLALRRTFDLRPAGDKLAYDNFVDACVIAGPRIAQALLAALDVVAEARLVLEHDGGPRSKDNNINIGYNARERLYKALNAFGLATADKGERG